MNSVFIIGFQYFIPLSEYLFLMYIFSVSTVIVSGPIKITINSKYAFHTQFNIIFLIDDSGNMTGRL
jgi:hypothetical protein